MTDTIDDSYIYDIEDKLHLDSIVRPEIKMGTDLYDLADHFFNTAYKDTRSRSMSSNTNQDPEFHRQEENGYEYQNSHSNSQSERQVSNSPSKSYESLNSQNISDATGQRQFSQQSTQHSVVQIEQMPVHYGENYKEELIRLKEFVLKLPNGNYLMELFESGNTHMFDTTPIPRPDASFTKTTDRSFQESTPIKQSTSRPISVRDTASTPIKQVRIGSIQRAQQLSPIFVKPSTPPIPSPVIPTKTAYTQTPTPPDQTAELKSKIKKLIGSSKPINTSSLPPNMYTSLQLDRVSHLPLIECQNIIKNILFLLQISFSDIQSDIKKLRIYKRFVRELHKIVYSEQPPPSKNSLVTEKCLNQLLLNISMLCRN